MPVGSPAFVVDSRTNVANVAPQHELFVNETYPQIIPSYFQSISAESGGTQLESMECARLIIGSVSGNHLMFIGGLDQNAPCSGRGVPLYPGLEGEREMFIENSNRVRICSTFSGELVYYMGYINGQPTSISPSTQGVQPNNQPPVLLSTTPLSGQHNIAFNESGTSFISIFNEDLASGSVDTDSYTVRLSGDFSSFLSGEVSFHQPDNPDDRTQIKFIPYSGQLVGSSFYNVYIGQRVSDDPGSTIPSTLTWSFVTAGLDLTPMVLKSHEPISGTGNLALDSTISATFNKAISGIVNTTGYRDHIYLWKDLDGPTVGVSGVSLLDDDTSGKKLIFTPNEQLAPLTLYRYAISGVTDTGGTIANPKSGIAFSTTIADTQGPIISGVFVLVGAAGIGTQVNLYQQIVSGAASGAFNGTNIVVNFNENISGIPGATISGNIITLVESGALGTELVGVNTLDADRKTVTFNPNIDLTNSGLYQIRISGVLDLNNNFITQTFPARSGIAFRVWGEDDVTAPTVNSITPISGAANVAVNTNITVELSEAISGTAGTGFMAGIQPIAVLLSGTGNVAGDITLNVAKTQLLFNPTVDLSGDRTYYVSVSGLLDGGDNIMVPTSGHAFRTTDNVRPLVSGIVPISGSPDFDVAGNIVVTFSEALTGVANSAYTGTGASGVVVYESGFHNNKVAGTVTLNTDRTQLTFNPTNDLTADEYYQVAVSGVRDISNNVISAADHVGTVRLSGHGFKTASGPVIISTIPTSGAINFPLGQDIVITFNKALTGDPGVFYSGSVIGLVLSGSAAHISGTRQLNAAKTQITFNPITDLTSDKLYLLSVSGVRDEANVLISQTVPPRSGIAFRTQIIDTSPPTITNSTPASGASGVAVTTTYIVNFSEDISGTLTDVMPVNTVRIAVSHGTLFTPIAGAVTKTATNQLTFTPSANLSGLTWYKTAITGVYDFSNNAIVPVPNRPFRTVDNTVPTVSGITPASGSVGFNRTNNMVITMSERCSGNTSVSAISLVTTAAPSTLIPGAVTVDTSGYVFTFNPAADLVYSTEHQLRVSGMKDTGGNFMTPVSGHSFTTEAIPLNIFYENVGTTESIWNGFNPDKSRMGIVRANTPSSLNGKVIKRASWKMRRIGSKLNSLVSCRIYKDTDDGGGDNGIAVTLQSVEFNTIPTTATRVAFENLNNTYAMTTDDCIAIEWPGADGSTSLVMYHSGDEVDSDDTIRASFDGEWKWLPTEDADAKLEG